MANDCYYEMRAVSKDKAAIERLVRIMNYEDEEFYLYRVFSEYDDGIEEIDGGYFAVKMSGDVAWSATSWIQDKEDKNKLVCLGYEKNEDGIDNLSKPVYGTAHYANLPVVCKALNVGVEVWTEELGFEFQQHIVVDSQGEVVIDDCVDYSEVYDEDTDEFKQSGGFDDFGSMLPIKMLYKEVEE